MSKLHFERLKNY